MTKSFCGFLLLLLCGGAASAQSPVKVIQTADGVQVKTATDVLKLTVCGPSVFHVVASPDGTAGAATQHQPWLITECTPVKFTLKMPEASAATGDEEKRMWQNKNSAVLDTGTVRVRISLDWGNLEFEDEQGSRLLQEFQDEPRSYRQVTWNGEQLLEVRQQFYPAVQEGLYGLGQHQGGVFNYRGTTVDLTQANTDVAIPLMVSTKGYGIFWNTAASSTFDNRFPSEMRFKAHAAHAIDYYFLYGPEMDTIVHEYRALTGHAPLYGQWAYGFFQSKDRYKSSDDLLRVANEYRAAHVPMDVLVQDWYWWVKQGDPEFRPEAYPDVPATLKKLHDQHVHAMLSVWAIFDKSSKNLAEMQARNLTIPGTTNYDPTNPAARDFYWNNLIGREFAQGWDAFWLDSSEPEIAFAHGGESNGELMNRQLFIGNGALYTNLFPLMHTGTVYDHWRKTTDQKRVYTLTRSGFAGDQRYAVTTWSGDVFSTFTAFERQVPAGLNFALSGMPYWTTDIAGYGPPYARDTHDRTYQELYARWFEFGVFCPIFRTHGHRANEENELFSYGAMTPTLVHYDQLRYRLLPYIYSLAWRVTSEDATIMRPLVMDWRTDEKVWNIGDEYMFGPALLVSPVTQEGASQREVYLPAAPAWYDFWTGARTGGGQRITAKAPVDRIPVYVKAGSIVPMGPVVEYAGQKPGATLEVRIYPGANGSFTLYEDEGDTYNYEKGARALIPIEWNDASRTLKIGARQGQYPGMPQSRRFRVVVVSEGAGNGWDEAAGGRQVEYHGAETSVTVQ